MWFSEHLFVRAKTCCVVCHTYCFCYGGTNMARKMSEKPHSIRLLRWFNFSQSGSRKNNTKAFEGASMEPTIFGISAMLLRFDVYLSYIPICHISPHLLLSPSHFQNSLSTFQWRELMEYLFCWFHGPRIISAALNVVFWTFFRTKTCCVVCHTYCFCYGGTNMAQKTSENHIPFDFWDYSTLANQGAGKTIEKPLKELLWNQQSLGFLRERFSKSTEESNHSRIIYRNDIIARLIETW